MAAGQQLSKGTPDGVLLGQTTSDKIGFYGLASPIVQPAGAAAVASTAATSTNPYGFTTSTQADAVVTLVNKMRAALVALNLMASS